MTGERCGSWHLCDLIEQAFSLPKFLELPMAYGTNKSLWLKRLPKELFLKTFNHLKIIRSHFENSGLNDSDRDKIEKSIPELGYLWLWRNCPYERAASMYCAEQLGVWRSCKASEAERYINTQVSLDEYKLLSCLKRAKAELINNWHGYFTNRDVLRVYYEELRDDPYKIIDHISEKLNMKIKSGFQYRPNIFKSTNKITPVLIDKMRRIDEKLHTG